MAQPLVVVGIWQVCGCAGLCALGSVAGLIAAVDECAYHVARPVQAVGYVAAALSLGAILGLWIPRRLARRRILNGSGKRNGGELDSAASLAGSLMLALGFAWLLLCGFVFGMESYRAFVLRRFMLPTGIAQAMVLGPMCLGCVLVGAVGTTTLLATRGWYRLLSAWRAPHTLLWAVMLAAAALSATVMAVITSRGGAALVTLLPVFAAGVLAVYRRWPATNVAERPPAATTPLSVPLPLAVTAVAALSVGLAAALALSHGACAVGDLGRTAAGLLLGALAGLLLARAILRLSGAAPLAPLTLLVAALPWTLAHHADAGHSTAEILWLAGVACGAVATLNLIGRRFALAFDSVQLALARVGGTAIAFAGVAALVGAEWLVQTDVRALAWLVVLITIAVAGLSLVLDSDIGGRLRIGGLVAAVACLGALSLLGEPASHTNNAGYLNHTTDVDEPAMTAACTLYDGHANQLADDVWMIDHGGPRHDVVEIPRHIRRGGAPLDRRAGRRMARRCSAALLSGGYLVLELPAGELAAAALDVARAERKTLGWESYVLHVSADDGLQDVLLIGPDVPGWVRQHHWPEGVEASLVKVERQRDLPSQ